MIAIRRYPWDVPNARSREHPGSKARTQNNALRRDIPVTTASWAAKRP
jgi:hypothetical protein